MAISSINFQPVKANSKSHNERLVDLDYNFPELAVNNETWKSGETLEKQKQIAHLCKKISGRKLQKNAVPVREAVVNLNAHHSMNDLKRLAKRLETEKKIKCFQIHIHRDEGVSRNKLNYHAHMLFDWQNKETGKMLRLNKLDISQIQTIVADSLNMERGELKVNTNRKRLEAVEYKRHQEKLKLEKLQSYIKDLEQKKNEARESNNKAREEYKQAQTRHQKIRVDADDQPTQEERKWAYEGIQEFQPSLRRKHHSINKAIEFQQRELKKLAASNQTAAKRIREFAAGSDK